MFDKGEKLVCVNDEFDPEIRDLYRDFPVKGKVYTCRECVLGRAKASPSSQELSFLVLLEEIVNDPDPLCHNQHELGYRSDRFVPVDQIENEEHRELAELIPAGTPVYNFDENPD